MVGCVERHGGGCGDCRYRSARPPLLLVVYVVFSLSLPFSCCPAPSRARTLALYPLSTTAAQHKTDEALLRGRAQLATYLWHRLGRAKIWRIVRYVNKRTPLHVTRITMGDTERALLSNTASFRSVLQAPTVNVDVPAETLSMLARRHDARADWCAADRHERHFTMIRFGWMAYVYIWHSSYIYIYIYIYVYIYIYIYI